MSRTSTTAREEATRASSRTLQRLDRAIRRRQVVGVIAGWGLRLLARLHARGFHAAVLAALVVMPTVASVGFLTRGIDPDPAHPALGSMPLRPTFDGDAAPATGH